MGDINHGNCVVLFDGTVKLIDCDSYSIGVEDFRYPCDVGVATHLAPELQGMNLCEAVREKNHDNFGLAVMIFQLLFLGRHPFAGNYRGARDKTLEECIAEKRFAYGDNADFTKVAQPPGTLFLSEVTPRMAAMFERAFLIDERPEPHEWVEALEELQQNLKRCDLHPGHFHYGELRQCPWCRIESETGLVLFPFVTSLQGPNGETKFDVLTVENLVARLSSQSNFPLELPDPHSMVYPPPSTELTGYKRSAITRSVSLVVIQFFAITALIFTLGITFGFLFGLVVMFFSIVYIANFDKDLRTDLNYRLMDLREKWSDIEGKLRTSDFTDKFAGEIRLIKETIDGYRKFEESIAENSGKRRLLEREIEQLYASLRTGSAALQHQQQKLYANSELTLHELLQAESDRKEVGGNSLAVAALFLVTFISPFLVGSVMNYSSAPKIRQISGAAIKPVTGSGENVVAIPLPKKGELPSVVDVDVEDINSKFVPDESISDYDIWEFPDAKRREFATILYFRAQNSLAGNPSQTDYLQAELKLRFALRFQEKDTGILNVLGYVLYERKHYSEALIFLNRALEIKPNDSNTKYIAGLNYLALKDYDNAIAMLKKAVEGEPSSGEARLKLGLAYMGNKEYQSARDSFQRSVELNGSEDAHFQLGMCLFILNDKSGAYREFEILRDQRSNLADKLYVKAELNKYDFTIKAAAENRGPVRTIGSR